MDEVEERMDLDRSEPAHHGGDEEVAEQERQAQEAAVRAEQERQAREAAERAEQERQAQEAAVRAKQE